LDLGRGKHARGDTNFPTFVSAKDSESCNKGTDTTWFECNDRTFSESNSRVRHHPTYQRKLAKKTGFRSGVSSPFDTDKIQVLWTWRNAPWLSSHDVKYSRIICVEFFSYSRERESGL
jgi:hypothetical protein